LVIGEAGGNARDTPPTCDDEEADEAAVADVIASGGPIIIVLDEVLLLFPLRLDWRCCCWPVIFSMWVMHRNFCLDRERTCINGAIHSSMANKHTAPEVKRERRRVSAPPQKKYRNEQHHAPTHFYAHIGHSLKPRAGILPSHTPTLTCFKNSSSGMACACRPRSSAYRVSSKAAASLTKLSILAEHGSAGARAECTFNSSLFVL